MFEKILTNIEDKKPLVHSITNYVTVNDCANILLACGASPIMADDSEEVEEITSLCSATVINIGTLNKRTIEAMLLAGKRASIMGHPVILDPVGAGASGFRTKTVFELTKNVQFSVIRGNISEIKTVYAGSGTTKGVDADVKDRVNEENLDEAIRFAKELSQRLCSVIAITGAIDIVADTEKAYVIRNGHPMMSNITGTGCMLSCLIGAYCAANKDDILDATAAAVCAMGICGELAYDKTKRTDGGTFSFRANLIDYMSKMNPALLNGGIKIEVR